MSDNLVLEPISGKHFEEWKTILAPLPLSQGTFNFFLDMMENQSNSDSSYVYIVKTAEGELLGNVSVMNIRRGETQSGLVECKILEPHRQKGFGARALKAIEDIAFTQLQLNKLEVYASEKNTAGQKLLKKLGYQQDSEVFVKIKS